MGHLRRASFVAAVWVNLVGRLWVPGRTPPIRCPVHTTFGLQAELRTQCAALKHPVMASKPTFRARALDTARQLPVYRSDEVGQEILAETGCRSVPQMPTGMEKEEETVTLGCRSPLPPLLACCDSSGFCRTVMHDGHLLGLAGASHSSGNSATKRRH